jgi:hypothetical protein
MLKLAQAQIELQQASSTTGSAHINWHVLLTSLCKLNFGTLTWATQQNLFHSLAVNLQQVKT